MDEATVELLLILLSKALSSDSKLQALSILLMWKGAEPAGGLSMLQLSALHVHTNLHLSRPALSGPLLDQQNTSSLVQPPWSTISRWQCGKKRCRQVRSTWNLAMRLM